MVVTLHGYDINIKREWWEAGHGGAAMRDYPTRLLELGREPRVQFIAVSNAIREQAIAYGLSKDRIFVRYIGVDLAKFFPTGRPNKERQQRVLFVGRLVEKKGCEYLIRAFAKVQMAISDASLTVVGDGPLRPSLQELALCLGVRVQFLGALSSVEVCQELRLAKALCLPSIRAENGDAEGFGIVLLEAQASGVPVVTSAFGGSTEGIREGVTGFSFRERDVSALSAHLISLLTDYSAAASFAAAGPNFVADKFDLLRCTEGLESLYDRLVSRI
jgi:glycosyltransferase involved in cell wall biosynthesis